LPLSNQQIERYSRQIILPQVGGRGQERLLAARIAIVGEIAELETPLAYLVGAGIGAILLKPVGDNDVTRYVDLIDRMKGLNPEVKVDLASSLAQACDLTLVLIGSARARAAAEGVNAELRTGALIAARLDSPGEVVILPARPPCLACTGEVPGDFCYSTGNADLIKMVATTEALKQLIQPGTDAVTIKFKGLSSVAAGLATGPGCIICTGKGTPSGQK
jgi:hypothetical protein